jgi:hypothetical protein
VVELNFLIESFNSSLESLFIRDSQGSEIRMGLVVARNRVEYAGVRIGPGSKAGVDPESP